MTCNVTGTATIQRNPDDSLTWLQADEEIHIAPEIVAAGEDYGPLWEKYELGDYCPAEHAYHGRRRDA